MNEALNPGEAYPADEHEGFFPCMFIDGAQCYKERCPRWVKVKLLKDNHMNLMVIEGCSDKVSPIVNGRLHDVMLELLYELKGLHE